MALHVLWADDDPYEHALMQRVVKECAGRLAIATCQSGKEAVALATGRMGVCAPLDLALVDLRMPDMDGFEVLRILKRDPSTKLLPVIVYSAERARADVLRAYEHGAAAYVVKPTNFESMCEFVGLLERLWGGFVTTPRSA